jgi:hypothetical protein
MNGSTSTGTLARDYQEEAEVKGEKSSQVDPSWGGVVKWGGLCLLLSGAIALLFFVLVLATRLPLPVPAKQALEDPLGPTVLFCLGDHRGGVAVA